MNNSRTKKAKEILEHNKIQDIKELWDRSGYTIASIAKELNLNIMDVELIVLIYNIDKLLQTSKPKKENMEFLQVDEGDYIRIDTITSFEKNSEDKENSYIVYDMNGNEYSIKDVSIKKLTKLMGAKIINPK